MVNNPTKPYDLEERTFKFARRCRDYIKTLPRTITNIEYGKQLARSSGSQAANYIEANEAQSTKDFIYRIKICKKETKETILWLKLAIPQNNQEAEQQYLLQEAGELMNIFGAIFRNTNNIEKDN